MLRTVRGHAALEPSRVNRELPCHGSQLRQRIKLKRNHPYGRICPDYGTKAVTISLCSAQVPVIMKQVWGRGTLFFRFAAIRAISRAFITRAKRS